MTHITLPRAVVKQALEALETVMKDPQYPAYKEITALRDALKKSEEWITESAPITPEAWAALEASKEVEPVAIIRTHKTGGNAGISKHVHPYGAADLNELPEGTLLYPAPAVPEGWQLVPKEPTPEQMDDMREAAHQYIVKHGRYDNGMIDKIYKAMLAAAPEVKK